MAMVPVCSILFLPRTRSYMQADVIHATLSQFNRIPPQWAFIHHSNYGAYAVGVS
jgi:hypothetical protein